MSEMTVRQDDKDKWRAFIVWESVNFLSARKEEIYKNYAGHSKWELTQEVIEEIGLMDFELAITFLQDKKSGLGKGFLGINLIR